MRMYGRRCVCLGGVRKQSCALHTLLLPRRTAWCASAWSVGLRASALLLPLVWLVACCQEFRESLAGERTAGFVGHRFCRQGLPRAHFCLG